MNIKKKVNVRNSAFLLFSIAIGSTSTAISAGGSANIALEEVIVTAQKRSQSLQDVPISISAVDGRRVNNLGLQNLNDVMALVPGVTFTAVGPGEGNLVIRGVASSEILSTDNQSKETVGFYIDEVPAAQGRFNPDLSPFDLERIEVLRGPQGTLYGAGSLSGTVRYITKKPDLEEISGALAGDVSSTEGGGTNYTANGMLNLPISDTLGMRAVISKVYDDGFIKGIGPAHRGSDVNDADKISGRLAVRWQPNDQLTVDAIYFMQDFERDAENADEEGPATFLTNGMSVGKYEQYRSTEDPLEEEFDLYSLEINYGLEWATLTSVTSYKDRIVDESQDFTKVIPALIEPTFTNTSSGVNNRYWQDWTQELRVATQFEGPLNFIAGLFYMDTERGQFQSTPTPGFDADFSALLGVPYSSVIDGGTSTPDNIFEQRVAIEETQEAVFIELNYDITDRLTATVGLRWFDFEQNFKIATAGLVSGGNPPLDRDIGETDVNPKFLVSYEVSDDMLISAQASKGFRLGGANELTPQSLCGADLAQLGLSKAPESFDSETVWNYELSAKSSWLDKALVVNGALFLIDYEDMQITTTPPCGFSFIDNAGEAEAMGAEVEVIARPFDGFQLIMGGSYIDTELSEDVPGLNGQKGDRLPLSTKFQISLTGRYEFPVTDRANGYVQYSYKYTDEVIFQLGWQNNPTSVGQPSPSYELHNMRVGMEADNWNVGLFVNNLFDEEAILFEQQWFNGLARKRSRNQPRTFGVSASYHF